MEALTVAKHIERIILALVDEGKLSKDLIEAKAKTAAAYDKSMGTKTAALKAAGKPTTLIKDLAKRDASEELYTKIVAEESLKIHFSRMDTLKAQLNGYQSIYRHLDST